MIFWTSDWHINHANIIKYTNRPFKNVSDMNNKIISNCNERVKEEDTLFFVGDIGFKSGTGRGEGEPEKLQIYLDKIKCRNIIYIEGNHDYSGRNGFKTIIRKIIVHYGGKDICILHDPKFCDTNYEINLVGHVHNNWEIQRIRRGESFTDCYNVGVDVHNFYPVTYGEIISKLTKWRKNNELKRD